MNKLQNIQTFVTVVQEGSFTRAALRLAMSPQLVSKQVAQLESGLGTRLLNRTTRRIHLTEAGTHYLQRAQQVLQDIDDMECQLGDMQTQARGTLRISAPVSFATRHLAPLLAEFQQAQPEVKIDLQLNDRRVDIIEEGFDIALRVGHLQSSSLIAKRLAPVRLAYCASPAYLSRYGTPTTLDELSAHQYLRYTNIDSSREPSAQVGFMSNNGDVLIAAAVAGAGIVLQPTFITSEAIQAGQLSVILAEHEPAPMGLYAVYAHRQLMASKVRAFIDFIADRFGEPPLWDRF